MTIEDIFDQLLNLSIWVVAKVFVLIALGLYIAFAVMVLREVSLMNRTLKGVFNLPITIIAWLHLVFALLIFVFALVFL